MTDADTTRQSIDSFDGLLAMIRDEPSPCRLLTILVKAETSYRRKDGEAMVDEGLLEPLMTRDWPVTPELNLSEIVSAADEVSTDWRFMMTAVLPGMNGVAPTPGDCEPHLERMAKSLMLGENLAAFAFFDRQGQPVSIVNAERR